MQCLQFHPNCKFKDFVLEEYHYTQPFYLKAWLLWTTTFVLKYLNLKDIDGLSWNPMIPKVWELKESGAAAAGGGG